MLVALKGTNFVFDGFRRKSGIEYGPQGFEFEKDLCEELLDKFVYIKNKLSKDEEVYKDIIISSLSRLADANLDIIVYPLWYGDVRSKKRSLTVFGIFNEWKTCPEKYTLCEVYNQMLDDFLYCISYVFEFDEDTLRSILKIQI